MRAARSASVHRLALIPLFVAAALMAAPAPADAARQTAADYIAAAEPSVKAALEAGGLNARNALATVVQSGLVKHQTLTDALSHENFAKHASATIIALADVLEVDGAISTFEKIGKIEEEGGIRGAAFEIQVGAALGKRVLQIGGKVDGDEVDALLTDGTRVEVKNDAPDAYETLSPSLFAKAEKQLKLRGRYGDPVMLVANEPLSQDQLESFRTTLGKAASVMVLDSGSLTTQLDREVETPAELTARRALARLRPMHHTVATQAARVARTMRRLPRQRRAVRARQMVRRAAHAR